MKRNYVKLMAALLSVAVSVAFVSCGDDDDEKSGPSGQITPVEPSASNAMSIAEQKEYLESTALTFMELMPSSDFSEIAELGKFIGENYIDDYDWENVEEWGQDAFDAAREALGTKTTDKEIDQWGNYTYKTNYVYTNYKALLMASNFTGHFTARNGRWVLEKANDLQFVFNDKRGQQCVLKLETGGAVKKVYAFNIDDWLDYEWESQGNTYISTEYYDRTQCTIGVPEKIVVTLTQGGNQVVKTTVSIDLGSIVGEEFDISRSSISVAALIELNNGYKFNVSKVAYTANTNASMSFTMSKNGTSLVSMSMAADVKDIPSVNLSAFSSESFDDDDYDFDEVKAKNAFVKLDILGKVQIQGTLSDVKTFADYLEKAADNDESESAYKSYINQANSLVDLNLFYDGKSVKQASVKLEPFADDEGWGGHTYWTVEPVLYFYDGSSYSTFEAFFNDSDFKATIDTFKKLANKYADLVDERIDW